MEQKLVINNFFIYRFKNFLLDNKSFILCSVFLLGTFIAIVSWFESVDFYHQHFYSTGIIVSIYNFFKIGFAFFLFWLICAAGYLICQLFHIKMYKFTFTERLVIEFGMGVGVWHIILFVLGMLNLYYRSVMIILSMSVLILSTKRFYQFINDIKKIYFENSIYTLPDKVNVITISLGLFCLLLVRGLYPGGGGDYFTHYFYYYTEVIRNHGLAPNDVWYHYYYSKGAGLAFLGILLTDFEAPQIATFCCVAAAALALMSLSNRIIPKSLWPMFATLSYIFFSIMSPTTMGSGEFQKTHEETSALIILLVWAICMYNMRPMKWKKLFFTMMMFTVIAASIVTQATAIFMGILLSCFAAIALWKKNIKEMFFYGLLTSVTCLSVISIFLINYLETGLVTDQAIELAWHFANVEKLNHWGVIPNVFLVSWIRNNYVMVLTQPFLSLFSVQQLINFMRLKELWTVIFGSFIPIFLTYLFRNLKDKVIVSIYFKFILNNLLILSLSIFIFSILSLLTGLSQPVSFFRFCSFFVPLIILFGVISWGLFISKYGKLFSYTALLKIKIPIILFLATIFSVHYFPFLSWRDGPHKIIHLTKDSVRLVKGRFSLEKAYMHQHQGLPFGGINPDVGEAVKFVLPGERIWSTNVDSYCMMPNCKIESVISFKLSSRLNEILNGSPEVAKKILQEEKINYFLFSYQSQLIDLLVYSRLFNIATLSQYFSIKWTNGSTYLLTWKNPMLKELDAKFFKQYISRLKEPESDWFKFSVAVPKLNIVMKQFEKLPLPWPPENFPSPQNS